MKIQTSRQFLARLAARRSARAVGTALTSAILLLSGSYSRATTYNYVGGTNGLWSTPGSWNPNGVPGAGDTATFTGAAAQAVFLNGNQFVLDLSFTATANTSAVRASAAGNILTLGATGGTASGAGGIQYGSTQTDLGGGGVNTMVISLAGSQFWTNTGSGLIQLNAGIATTATQSITNGTSGAVTLTFDGTGTSSKSIFGRIDDGVLGGTTALVLNSTGTTGSLKLLGDNIYSGGTTFTAGGGLELDANTALGTGALTINGAALSGTVLRPISTAVIGGITLTNNNAQNWNADFMLQGTQNINFGAGNVTMSGARTIYLNTTGNPVTYTEGGIISGSGASLTLTSAAVGGTSPVTIDSQLILNGANTYTGGTNINGGLLRFGPGAVPGTGAVVLNGGALAVGTGTAFTTLASATSGVTLTKGALALVSDSSENFTAPNGNIYLGAALGSFAKYTGTLGPVGGNYNVGGGGGTIIFGNTNAFTGGNSIVTGGGPSALLPGGGGTVIITGQNTNTGSVTINEGTLQVSSLGSGGSTSSNLGAPATGAAGIINIDGGNLTFAQLRYTGTGETTDRTLNDLGTSGSGIVLDASGSGAVVFNGAFNSSNSNSTNRFVTLRGIDTDANTITVGIGTQTTNPGALGLTKDQRGNWTLTGSNNFATGLTVKGGTLTADYASNTSVLGGSPNLALGGGTLAIKGNNSGGTTQTLGNSTLSANTGQSNVSVTGNGTAGSAVLTLGNRITRGSNTFLNFSLVNGGQITTSPTAITNNSNDAFVLNGVLVGGTNATSSAPPTTGVAVFTVTDATGADFATITGGQIAKLGSTTALPTVAGSSTANYLLTGAQTQTGSTALNTLRISPTASGTTLALGANGFTTALGALSILKDSANDYTITGTASLAAGSNISVNLSNFGTGALTVSANTASGTGALTKTGPGLVVANVAQTYTGATNIFGGVLRINSTLSGSSNIVLNTGGILELGSANFTGTVGTGGGQVQWTNGDGGFSAFGGNRTVALTNALGATTGQLVWGSTSGNGYVTAPNVSPNFVKDGYGLLLSSSTATGTLDFQNPIDFVNLPRAVVVGDGTAAVDAVLSGVLSSSDYSGGLDKSGAGTLALTGANTYTGETRILAGTLLVGNGGTTGTLGNGGNVTNNGILVFNRTDAAQSVANIISGTGTLTQAGTGTTTLTGNNTYSGTTSVNAGTLLVNNAPVAGVGSGTGTGAVAVNNTGTLGGTGAISGATTVGAGGQITGASLGTIGALTLRSTVTFNGASGSFATYAVDIGSGTNNSDKLAITGALDLSGSFDQITFTGTPDGTSSYVLATYGSVSGTFDNGSAPAGYSFQYNGTELDLVVAPVPEPATYLGGLLTLGAFGYSQRRRMRTWLSLLRGGHQVV